MKSAIVSLLLCCAALHNVSAQIISGTIVGTATDASGSLVANAKITATNESTGVLRSTATDSSGGYVLPQLPPGNYKLSASAPGFSTYDVSHIVLLVDQTARVDVHFELGAVNQQVEVQATAAQLDSETSTLGEVIESQRIVDLPM